MILCPSCGVPALRPVLPKWDPWEVVSQKDPPLPSFVCACGLLRQDPSMDGCWLLVPGRCAMWGDKGRIYFKEDGGVARIVPSGALEEKISWMVVCAVVDS